MTPWTVAHQAPLSMGFSRQEYWSGLPFPPPEDLPHPGIELVSLTSPALAARFFSAGATWETPGTWTCFSALLPLAVRSLIASLGLAPFVVTR